MAESTRAPSPNRSRSYLVCGILVGVVALTTALLAFNWDKIWSNETSVSDEAPFEVDLDISLDANAPPPTFDALPSDIYLTRPNAHDHQTDELFPDQVSFSYQYAPREAQTPDRTDESPIAETNRLRRDFVEQEFRIGFVEGSTFTSIKPRGRRGASAKAAVAIDDALDWLAAHQLSDGSWSFDHRGGVCNGRCDHHGALKSCQNAATALALIPLIRAGHSRPDKRHFTAVQNGLRYLIATAHAGTLAGGRSWESQSPAEEMFSHAIATIAISEGYAAAIDAQSWLEHSEEARRWQFGRPKFYRNVSLHHLRGRTIAAVNAIVQSQNEDGGWSSQASGPSDTSTTSAMIVALWSGHRAGLKVPASATQDAIRFLATTASRKNIPWYFRTADQLQSESAAKSPTAMAWLCRVATGASPDNPQVIAGAEQLAKWGPAVGDAPNLVYNYFATEMLYRVGGKAWDSWCSKVRDDLVSTQNRERSVHAFGSWYVASDAGSKLGGRTYCTAIGALTLAVFCQPTAGKLQLSTRR